jgi:hypothetical protein
MNSAILSVIGTLSGAIAGVIGGYLTTSRATVRTLRVQTENSLRDLDAAHGQRLRDMQAPAYEQAIAALSYRRDMREHDLSPIRWDKRTASVIRSTIAEYNPPNWYESQSRLALYASRVVLDANEVANDTHEKILGLIRELADIREAVEATEPTDRDARAAFGGQHSATFKKIQAALQAAATADANLRQLMRAGVHTRPSQELPASPRTQSRLKAIAGGFRRKRVAPRSTT